MAISFLSLVIAVKITVTLILVALPFLLAPQSRLEALTATTAPAASFFRLYGVAILALLVGYAFAFPVLQANEFPWAVTIMGAVSNGGAAAVLLTAGPGRSNRGLGFLFGAFFLALVAAMLLPDLAIAQIN